MTTEDIAAEHAEDAVIGQDVSEVCARKSEISEQIRAEQSQAVSLKQLLQLHRSNAIYLCSVMQKLGAALWRSGYSPHPTADISDKDERDAPASASRTKKEGAVASSRAGSVKNHNRQAPVIASSVIGAAAVFARRRY